MMKGLSMPVALMLMLGMGQSGIAQIIPDQTLGQESSTLTPNVQIRGGLSNQIDGGAIRAGSLFHSFSEFNVEEFHRVYFANPVGVESIFSRVTGTNVSDIMGTLGVDGSADLFLLNPNGIIFGPNAELDITGSFLATTAEAFTLSNGRLFSAVTPDIPALLSVSLKPGLQWQGTEVASINSQGQLVVGQDLTLAGGDLNLQGILQSGSDLRLQGLGTVTIRDDAAEPFVASSAGDLLVQGHQRVDIFALNHPNSGLVSQGDLTLQSGGAVIGDAHFSTGGNFRIEQLDETALGWSSIVDPIIRSAGDVIFDNYTGASLHVLAGGSVTTGDIEITGADTLGNSLQEQVTLSDGVTVVEIDGNAEPTLDIRAGTLVVNPVGMIGEIAGFGAGEPQSEVTVTTADISVGNITNPGGQVFLSNQYQPNLSLAGGVIQVGSINTGIGRVTEGVARGGDAVVDARGSVDVTGDITTAARAGTFEESFLGGIENISAAGNNSEAHGGDIILFSGNNITVTNLDSSTIAVTQAEQTRTLLENGTEQVEAGAATAVAVGGNITLESMVNMPDQLVTQSVGNINVFNINSSTQTLVDTSVDASTEDGETNAGKALAGTITTQAHAGDVSLSTQVTGGDMVAEPSAIGTIDVLEINAEAGIITTADAEADAEADAFTLANTGDIPTAPGTPNVEIINGNPEPDVGGPPPFPFALDVTNQGDGGIAIAGKIQNIEIYGGSINLGTRVAVGDIAAGATIGTISANNLDTKVTSEVSAQSSSNTSSSVPLFTPAVAENNGSGGTATSGTVENITNQGGEIALQTQVNTGNVSAMSHIGNINTSNLNTAADLSATVGAVARASNSSSGKNRGNGGRATGGNVETLQNSGGPIVVETSITTENVNAESDIGNLSTADLVTWALLETIADADATVRVFDFGSDGENIGNGGNSTGGKLQSFENRGGNISLNTEISLGTIAVDSNVGILTTENLSSTASVTAETSSTAAAGILPNGSNSGNGGLSTGGTIQDVQTIAGEISLNTTVILEETTTESLRIGDLLTASLRTNSGIDAGISSQANVLGVGKNTGVGGTAIGGIAEDFESRGGAISLTTTAQTDLDAMAASTDMSILQITDNIDTSSNVSVGANLNVSADSESERDNTGSSGQAVDVVINTISTQGGQVTVNAQGTLLTENIDTSGDTFDVQGDSSGSAGDVRLISTFGDIRLGQGALIQTNVTGADGNGGDISFSGKSLQLIDNTLTTVVSGQGNSGNIFLNARDTVDIHGSRLISGREFETSGAGTGGDIDISAGSVQLTDFALLNTSTAGTGNAGSIRLTSTSGDITLSDSSFFSLTAGDGNAGTITIQSADALRTNGNSVISTAVVLGASGNGGNIHVDAADGVFIQGTGLAPIELPVENQSNINEVEPNNNTFFISNSASAQSIDTFFAVTNDPNVVFSDEAPHVTIFGKTNDEIPNPVFPEAPFPDSLDTYSFNIASAGTQVIFDIDDVETDDVDGLDLGLYLYDASNNIIAFNDNAPATLGQSGSTDSQDPFLTYIFNEPGTYFITVAGPNSPLPGFSLNPSLLTTPGSYTLNISRVDASLVNSGITTQTRTSGTAGDITINAPIIDIQNGGQISSETLRNGQAGNITLQPFQNETPSSSILTLSERSTISAQATQAGGTAGNITIETDRVEINSGAAILASNQDAQTGGNISLQGLEIVELDNGSISAETLTGRAGNIEIAASDEVRLQNGSALSVETKLGNPNNTTLTSPVAGDLSIQTQRLAVEEDSRILVQSLTGQAGNIDIETSRVALNNGEISAVTSRTPENGADSATIDIKGLDLLFLENNSLISARALVGANGGNINIAGDDAFIIALPLNNSDIIATADDGAGGEITISVAQLFGLTQQDISIGLENNRTNDISASSTTGPQGVVTLNTLNIDPTQGLLELPEAFADSFSFDAVCNAAAQGGNTFMRTGRGGLPAAPTTLPNNIDPWEDWFVVNANDVLSASIDSTVELSDEQISTGNSNNVEQVTEAQGWLVTHDGTTMLVVDSGNALISTNGALKPLACEGLKDAYLN